MSGKLHSRGSSKITFFIGLSDLPFTLTKVLYDAHRASTGKPQYGGISFTFKGGATERICLLLVIP